MLTGIIVAVVVGVIGAIAAVVRSSKARSRLNTDLAARGIPIQPGAGALQVPPNRLMIGGDKPPQWSAAVPGQPFVQVYGFGSWVIAAWRVARPRPGAFVVTWMNGSNPDRARLQEVPRKQLPVKGVRLFASAPELTHWVMSAPILPTFAQRFGKERGWHFVYVDGVGYLFSAESHWAGLDDVMQTAARFEQAIA
jgi:hypothetical protein